MYIAIAYNQGQEALRALLEDLMNQEKPLHVSGEGEDLNPYLLQEMIWSAHFGDRGVGELIAAWRMGFMGFTFEEVKEDLGYSYD